MVRVLVAILALMLAVIPQARAQNGPITGAWSGLGLQLAPAETWTISLSIGDNGSGRIDYPSLDCGGMLTFEATHGQVLLYRERITYGDCVDNGLIGVYPHAGRLMWFWSGEDTLYPSMAASAVLTRVAPTS